MSLVPSITRLPLGRTSVTRQVICPLALWVRSVEPSPVILLDELKPNARMKSKMPKPSSTLLSFVLLASVVPSSLVLVFSSTKTVTISPTCDGRRSAIQFVLSFHSDAASAAQPVRTDAHSRRMRTHAFRFIAYRTSTLPDPTTTAWITALLCRLRTRILSPSAPASRASPLTSTRNPGFLTVIITESPL